MSRWLLVGALCPFPEAQLLSAYCDWVNAANFSIPRLNHIRLRLVIAEQPLATSPASLTGRKLLFSP